MAKEFEGRDLDEAKRAAAEALGIAEPELDYEIVEQGRRGLFGIGAKSVRIRIMPPVEHPARPSRPARPTATPARRREGAPDQRREGRRRRRRPRSKSTEGEAKPQQTPISPEMTDVRDTVRRMLGLMGLKINAEARPIQAGVALDLTGPDKKLLTKKDRELLAAMEFLLNRMSRRTWPDVGRIQLSCNGGRERGRDEDVVELVNEVVQQVSRTGRTKRLHPMNAYQRRLVHLTVRKHGGVASRSEGDGALKRVKIFKP
jgi:spoIIIJ-associated protein